MMQWAMQYGSVDLVKLLLLNRVIPAADGNWAIRWASQWGRREVVVLLLQDPRVNPAADENAAIRNAAWRGHLEVVALLLQDPRVEPAALDNDAIRNATLADHSRMVALLFRDPRVRAHCPRSPIITRIIHRTLSNRLLVGLYMKQHPHRAEVGLIPWIITYDPTCTSAV